MRVFVTGITGTLGTALTARHVELGDAVFGCARNESRAVEWLREHGKRATLFCCDAQKLADPCSDVGRLLPSIDRVYHCAALKHVDICQQRPEAAVDENVLLTGIVAAVCGPRTVFVSSDKACLPSGVYGATKLIAETLVTSRGAAVVRLVNLIGSSGSVFQKWKRQVDRGERVTLTDPEMTRFFMSVRHAVDVLVTGGSPGRVAVPTHARSARIGDVANAIAGPHVDVTGPRDGETRHQWLTSPGEQGLLTWKWDKMIAPLGDNGEGLSSEDAERWDVTELLREAGLR